MLLRGQTKEQQQSSLEHPQSGLGDFGFASAKCATRSLSSKIAPSLLSSWVNLCAKIERILVCAWDLRRHLRPRFGGCLHIRPVLDLKTGEGVRSMRSIAEAGLALTLTSGRLDEQ